MFLVNLIESSSVLKSLNARIPSKSFPGCENVEFKSRDYWECYIRHVTGSPDASSSTCRMGPDASDPLAVVDSELRYILYCITPNSEVYISTNFEIMYRVIHTERLRVIDSSIMPVIITGNPQAPTIMIGEVGSQLVLSRWKHRKFRTRKKD